MNSKNFNRAGMNRRTICYSMSFSPRKLEFLDPPKLQKPLELKGNSKTKVIQLQKEKHRQYKKFILPDTYRTTNPTVEQLNQTTHKFPSHNLNSPGNINSITSKEDFIPLRIRIMNRRNFMSKCMDVMDESFNLNVINNSTKNEIRQTPLSIYSNTTQILNLPGGVKRDSSLINDNLSFKNFQMKSTQSSISSAYKIMREYRTNISCLPATNYNIKIKELHIPDEKSLSKYKEKYWKENSEYNIISPKDTNMNKSANIPSRITNIKIVDNNNVTIKSGLKGEISNSNHHLFKSSSKRIVNLKNITSTGIELHRPIKRSISRKNLITSSEEKRIVETSKGRKPDFIKNAFQSQIQLI